MGNYTIFLKFENPRRGRQARNLSENDPKMLDLKSSSEQIIFRKLSLGAPGYCQAYVENVITCPRSKTFLGDLFHRFSSPICSQFSLVPNGRYYMQFEATILTLMTLLFSFCFSSV